jgi:hypothetical protein
MAAKKKAAKKAIEGTPAPASRLRDLARNPTAPRPVAPLGATGGRGLMLLEPGATSMPGLHEFGVGKEAQAAARIQRGGEVVKEVGTAVGRAGTLVGEGTQELRGLHEYAMGLEKMRAEKELTEALTKIQRGLDVQKLREAEAAREAAKKTAEAARLAGMSWTQRAVERYVPPRLAMQMARAGRVAGAVGEKVGAVGESAESFMRGRTGRRIMREAAEKGVIRGLPKLAAGGALAVGGPVTAGVLLASEALDMAKSAYQAGKAARGAAQAGRELGETVRAAKKYGVEAEQIPWYEQLGAPEWEGIKPVFATGREGAVRLRERAKPTRALPGAKPPPFSFKGLKTPRTR